MTDSLKRILPAVQKPARYTGGEFNEIKKKPEDVRVRIAFCFPDTYEIGMSNVGMRILYGVMNEMDGLWCERAFAPWGDMEEAMRTNNLPLWTLESQEPIKDHDMIAFTIGYEMCYTNILNMLRLSGIPLYAKSLPVVCAAIIRSLWLILLTFSRWVRARRLRLRLCRCTIVQRPRRGQKSSSYWW